MSNLRMDELSELTVAELRAELRGRKYFEKNCRNYTESCGQTLLLNKANYDAISRYKSHTECYEK